MAAYIIGCSVILSLAAAQQPLQFNPHYAQMPSNGRSRFSTYQSMYPTASPGGIGDQSAMQSSGYIQSNRIGGMNAQNPQTVPQQPYAIRPAQATTPAPIMPLFTFPAGTPHSNPTVNPSQPSTQKSGGKSSYAINYCNPDIFSDAALAQYGLQRSQGFVYNTSCSEIFFQCSYKETYFLKCPIATEAFDKAIMNCNFKRNMNTCPEFDRVLHCAIRDSCTDNEFACCSLPQKCIPIIRRCDGHKDCADGEDENNCPSCGVAQFACVKSGRCLPASKRCDGVYDDCSDGSNTDEIGCTRNSTCVGKFVCDSALSVSVMGGHNCIESRLRCNGIRDCPNGEDEVDCKHGDVLHIMCENQKESVPSKQWCNGYVDCSDDSDEKYCV